MDAACLVGFANVTRRSVGDPRASLSACPEELTAITRFKSNMAAALKSTTPSSTAPHGVEEVKKMDERFEDVDSKAEKRRTLHVEETKWAALRTIKSSNIPNSVITGVLIAYAAFSI